MIYTLSFLGNFLTFLIILVKNSPENIDDLFFQLLIFLGVPMLVGFVVPLMFIKNLTFLSNFTNGLFNRLFISILFFLLFIVPLENQIMLNDFFFVIILILNTWFWITWSYILTSKYKI